VQQLLPPAVVPDEFMVGSIEKDVRWRFVRRVPDKTGRHKAASSSDLLTEFAAQVLESKIPGGGIMNAIPKKKYERAKRLLKKNMLQEVRQKTSSKTFDHFHQQIRKTLPTAFREVIGPAYIEAKGAVPAYGLKILKYHIHRKTIADWIKHEIETPCSVLNKRLMVSGFNDLVELQRSSSWWYDRLGD